MDPITSHIETIEKYLVTENGTLGIGIA